MTWTEQLSSTATLGFRIEGIKIEGQQQTENYKDTRQREEIKEIFGRFTKNCKTIQRNLLNNLKNLRKKLMESTFFSQHEVVGSSLLFVHDKTMHSGVWMIDFGKTVALPEGVVINHRDEWKSGNHEDGYLAGLDNLIDIWESMI